MGLAPTVIESPAAVETAAVWRVFEFVEQFSQISVR